MRMDVCRYQITITPENDEDVAYIEEVLGLTTNHDKATVERVNAGNLNSLAYLEIRKSKDGDCG